jgi:ethylbenzene dioxygenase ferredoxin subunit
LTEQRPAPDGEAADRLSHRLCRAADVQDAQPVEATVEGLPPLAVFKVADDYFVTDNLCTHGSSLLTEGWQEGAVIECSFHGGSFDVRTGEPVGHPCTVALRTYEARVVDGWIVIAAPAVSAGAPE